jgi:NADH-quinone oxidoreductase subunit H
MAFIHFIINSFITLIPLLISIAFFTLAERKIMGAIQRRKGPNVVGLWGILQPFADGLKLLLKEIILPSKVSRRLFIVAPILSLSLGLIGWGFINFSFNEVFIENQFNILFLLAVSSFSVFGIILAGWASNSRYAFLGAVRSAAQIVSYEISLSLTILPCLIAAGSFNINNIVYSQQNIWYFFPFLPMAIVFLISMLAETNRAPFDLPEAEAELVAGFNVEYSSILFAMFFLGEYSNMLRMAALFSILYLGGWNNFFFLNGTIAFILKILLISFFFIFVRANFPRYRYDQLMGLGWKIFLPFSLSFCMFTISFLLLFDALLPVGQSNVFYYF